MSSSRGAIRTFSGLVLVFSAAACARTDGDTEATDGEALTAVWNDFRANTVVCNDSNWDAVAVVNDTFTAPDETLDPRFPQITPWNQFKDFGRRTIKPHACTVIARHERWFNETAHQRMVAAQQTSSAPGGALSWLGASTSCVVPGSEYEIGGHALSCTTPEGRAATGTVDYHLFRSVSPTGVVMLARENAGPLQPAAVSPTAFEICNDMLAEVTGLSFAYTTPEGTVVTENLTNLPSGCLRVERPIASGTDFYVRGSSIKSDGTAVAINGPTRLRVSTGAHGAVVWADQPASAWAFPVLSGPSLEAGFLQVAPGADAKYTYRFKTVTLGSLASTLEVCRRPDGGPSYPNISVVALESGSLVSVGAFHLETNWGPECVNVLSTNDTRAWVRATVGSTELIAGPRQFCVNNLQNFRIPGADTSACLGAGEDRAGFREVALAPGKNTVFLE